MFAAGTLDKMVNVQLAPAVRLGPPAHGTGAEEGGKLLENQPVSLGHCVQTLPFF
jgi:hypothetical protein